MNIDEIIARLHELEEENSMLKSLLFKHGIAYEKAKPEAVVLAPESEKQNSAMQRLTLQEKVDMFRSLFKGREDVFAKRWYSDTSKKQATNLFVSVNGIESFAINESINVQNVLIAYSPH